VPNIILWWLRRKRQQEIFLTLPDALDLLVVCVESGLGLDAAMRKVCEEMKDHAKVLAEELSLANFQLQMGRPRREVLHDLGVRTGVDDVRSLAAILIQADRFGSSIAQALRVQSDSMRTRRKQLAEEKAAKTAVQLIFPLVLFIFPGIFVVLVGPAAISIMETILAHPHYGACRVGTAHHNQGLVGGAPPTVENWAMNGFIRKSAAAVCMTGGLALTGCHHLDDYVDPCYPERYQYAARQNIKAWFAPQINNG